MQVGWWHRKLCTFICPFVEGKGKKLQKFEYLENENKFLDEIKAFFIFFVRISFGEKKNQWTQALMVKLCSRAVQIVTSIYLLFSTVGII